MQSHNREVPRWEIFIEQELRFGPIGSIEKKKVWADYEQLLRVIFSYFGGQKKIKIFFKKYFSNCIEKLHKMAFIIFFLIEKV